MNPIANAIQAAQRAARRLGGIEIVYRRGDDDLPLSATLGRSTWQLENGSAGLVVFESRDYLIDAAGLQLRGAPLIPQRHDKIVEGCFVYGVLDEASIPAWRYSDPFRLQIRVHTKLLQVLT